MWRVRECGVCMDAQILQRRGLAEVYAMGDVSGEEEGGSEVVGVACLARVRSERERV